MGVTQQVLKKIDIVFCYLKMKGFFPIFFVVTVFFVGGRPVLASSRRRGRWGREWNEGSLYFWTPAVASHVLRCPPLPCLIFVSNRRWHSSDLFRCIRTRTHVGFQSPSLDVVFSVGSSLRGAKLERHTVFNLLHIYLRLKLEPGIHIVASFCLFAQDPLPPLIMIYLPNLV